MNYSVLGMVRFRLSPCLFLLLLFATGCSVEKNTGTSRFYHNLTSLYNIYFNGNESYRQGTEKVSRSIKDNYTILLPVFDFQSDKTPSACASDMERAIQKASKVISQHSITAKPINKNNKPLSEKEKEFYNRKEYNLLLDDSYLLMGKARIYLHEYEKARTTLNYCINESIDPDVIAEARIWLAIINNITANYAESARIIKQYEESGHKGRSVEFLYHSAQADLLIKTGKFNEAASEINKAIDLASGKRYKYRYTYLLAQLYEKAGNFEKASDTFLAVTKMNTPYEIEFNARINHAGVFDIATGNPNEVRKELIKMTKDSKNKEYLDQIYYALGNLSAREGNVDDAIENYRKSVGASVQNNSQKGKSYLALGLYYYENPGYIEAGKYYDSAAFFLDKSMPEYSNISNRSKNLSQLVRQLEVIEREDSLQMVAAMTPQDRINLIYSIIEDVRKKETVDANPEYTDRYNLGEFYENERRFMESSGNTEGKWYFYNQSALTFGRTEFIRRWGDRKLEDNWRRSVKVRSGMGMGSGDEATENVTESTVLSDNKNPETYLKNVPLNDSMIVISDGKIANAYYEAGRIFYELFNDQQKAIETFDILLLRYPSHFRVPEALYRMVQIYKESDPARADIYRQKLIGSFPESEPAHLLTDPGYLQRLANTMKEADREYEICYNLYLDGKFAEAIAGCDNAVKKPNNESLYPGSFCLKLMPELQEKVRED